ncbi:DUF2188 domain-containing protein [Maricaulis sp.]|uniref:DUF2188 domain-containing protein n=1 Tax=Maricaulis sp. TaxID=1486257 RepID=UPI003A9239A6
MIKVSKNGQHVAPRGGVWIVRKSGAVRATALYKTQDEAIEKARGIAKKQKTELYIHGKDGRIRERSTYATEPLRRTR